jgi:hypothetical protein
MPFGLKTIPPTYQQIVNMAFCEYLKVFMNFFLDDFNVFNDLKTHLAKLQSNVLTNVMNSISG